MTRRRSRIIVATTFIGVSLITFISVVELSPRLVWNATPSAPIGLYKIEKRAPKVGEFVFIEPDAEVQSLIEERRYLPSNTPLIKRFFADSGAEICRENVRIFVDKTHVADALLVDSNDRKMPIWEGCFWLKSDEVFLLNNHEKSLDGRYFRATQKSQIIGVAVPVFVREPDE